MSQAIIVYDQNTDFGTLDTDLNTNFTTLRSQFSGTSFPSSPTVGQPCWRTDLGLGTVAGTTGKLYFYSGDTDLGSAGWITSENTSVYTAEITNARGSKLTLDQRLDIALNEDGTLKAGGAQYSSEWTTPALTFTYLSTITFKTDGNTEDIYLETRRLKVNLSTSNFKTEVVSAVYSGGADETTVTIADANLDNTLVSVEHSIISPIADDGALAPKMIKAANEETDLSVDLNVVSDANYTLTADENLYGRMELTTSLFTAPRNIIMDSTEHTFLFVNNEAYEVTVKTSAGTGIAVPAGIAKVLRNDTVNIIDYEVSSKLDLSVVHNIASDANYTLTADQNLYGRIEITDTGVELTTGRDIILDNIEHTFLFVNSTAQALTPKTSAGTGIAVPEGTAKELRNNTVNIIDYEASATAITGVLSMDNYMHIQDQKTTGTSGGSSVAGNQTRVLNTVLKNTISGASLTTNKISLPPGDYYVRALAPAYIIDRTRITIDNFTDTATLLSGSGGRTATGDAATETVTVSGFFNLAGTKEIQIRHFTTNAVFVNGLGLAVSDGLAEVFSEIEIWKVE